MRHQVVGFGLSKTFFDCTLDSHQTGTELVLRQFADATNTTVTQVIDIIHFATTITQFDKNLDDRQDVFV